MTLQMPLLPSEVLAKNRDLVMATGHAVCSAMAGRSVEARQRFEALIATYPSTPRVHYAFGLFLSLEGSKDALAMLRKEVSLFPENWQAHLQIALDLLAGTAGPSPRARAARRAVFAVHLALGRPHRRRRRRRGDRSSRRRLSSHRAPDVCRMAQGYARAGRTETWNAPDQLAALHTHLRPQSG
jgi:hypothetical protein